MRTAVKTIIALTAAAALTGCGATSATENPAPEPAPATTSAAPAPATANADEALEPEPAAFEECMYQAMDDAEAATGEPAEDFRESDPLLEACLLYVQTDVTIPLETGTEPDVEGPARTVACIGEEAAAAYAGERDEPFTQYEEGMNYAEIFSLAVVKADC